MFVNIIFYEVYASKYDLLQSLQPIYKLYQKDLSPARQTSIIINKAIVNGSVLALKKFAGALRKLKKKLTDEKITVDCQLI